VVCSLFIGLRGMEESWFWAPGGRGFGWIVGCGMGGQALVWGEITVFVLSRNVMTSMSLCENAKELRLPRGTGLVK
jgi:hypothetical protein